MAELSVIERSCEGWQSLPAEWPECLRKAMAARGVLTEQDLRFDLKDLPRPEQLSGMSAAVELLEQALREQWHIRIVADFDSDGATSCALAIRGLQAMGLQHIDYVVPNRFIHGYGLTTELLAEMAEADQPQLLITVDNGISAISGIALAKQRGMKVLVTDHHLAGETLPDADAIINPNQAGDNFPSKNLAGVGVVFYLLLGLRQHLRSLSWFEQNALAEPKVIDWLDLVALGTVADVVPLDKLNRTLVTIGIQRMRQQQCCVGIQALAKVAGKTLSELVSSDLSFSLAPRLNAAGRMEDMKVGIQLLVETDKQQALKTASWLDMINTERRAVEQQMQQEAIQMLDNLELVTAETKLGYCLYDETWHQGGIGLLASRMKERLHRPVVVFAPGNEGELKGSARSIPGVHIRDVLAHIAATHPQVLQRFGGHAMAAGMTIRLEDYAVFPELLEQSLSVLVDKQNLDKQLLSDGEINEAEMSLPVAKQLANAAPWGQAFEEPSFHGEFVVEQWRLLGQEQPHLRLGLRSETGKVLNAIAFRMAKPQGLQQGSRVKIHYRLSVNNYRDQESLQLLISELELT